MRLPSRVRAPTATPRFTCSHLVRPVAANPPARAGPRSSRSSPRWLESRADPRGAAAAACPSPTTSTEAATAAGGLPAAAALPARAATAARMRVAAGIRSGRRTGLAGAARHDRRPRTKVTGTARLGAPPPPPRTRLFARGRDIREGKKGKAVPLARTGTVARGDPRLLGARGSTASGTGTRRHRGVLPLGWPAAAAGKGIGPHGDRTGVTPVGAEAAAAAGGASRSDSLGAATRVQPRTATRRRRRQQLRRRVRA